MKRRYARRVLFFFFNDTATTEIYTLSLHDALPIYNQNRAPPSHQRRDRPVETVHNRSEEHTSELQSPCNLVCRLLLEKKKINDDEQLAWDEVLATPVFATLLAAPAGKLRVAINHPGLGGPFDDNAVVFFFF